jgi:hypothetical protein
MFKIQGHPVMSRIESPRRVKQVDDPPANTDGIGVDLNEPITLDQETLFCPAGNSLALLFLSASREAVKLSGIDRPEQLVRRVNDALLELLKHRYECPACNVM